MQFTDSFVLMMAIGLKIALLAFIFQDKLLAVLGKIRAAEKKRSGECCDLDAVSQLQQNQNLCMSEPEQDQFEQTKIDCSEGEKETENSEEDSCIIEAISQGNTVSASQRSPQTSKKKGVSLANLAKNLVAVSLIGANVKASAANKASSRLEDIAKPDLQNISSLLNSAQTDFESLVKIVPCEKFSEESYLCTGTELHLQIKPVSELNNHVYKSKRGTRLVARYIKFAQRRSELPILKSKKRLMHGKLTKVSRAIAKNRPGAFELQPILEESC